MTDLSPNWNGTRSGRTANARAVECQYQCQHCGTTSRWTGGGAASLGRHMTRGHGIPFSPFPNYACVDDLGYVVDHTGARLLRNGKPFRPDLTGLDGLIRTVDVRTVVI